MQAVQRRPNRLASSANKRTCLPMDKNRHSSCLEGLGERMASQLSNHAINRSRQLGFSAIQELELGTSIGQRIPNTRKSKKANPTQR
jgi:hypothetical protein